MSPNHERDLRLDFFRGIAMLIIYVAHMPWNPWMMWIPARFGASDAAEMFVFCSGFASAIAFGGSFARHGMAVGTLRVAHRCWQLYWAHLALFIAVAATLAAATRHLGTRDYLAQLNLHPFFDQPEIALPALMTLTYVPNVFDIIPLYIVVLAMMPVAVLLARRHRLLPTAVSLGLWLLAWVAEIGPPAEWWSDREWFFDPLSWQLLFYLGFALSAGWLPAPRRDRRMMAAALAVLLAFVPVSFWGLTLRWPLLGAAFEALAPLTDKTHFGPLRLLHFAALAYAAWYLVTPVRQALASPALRPVIVIGQQSLAVFLASMLLAQVVAIALDLVGRDALTLALGNIGGGLILAAIAWLVGLVRTQPWRRPAQASTSAGEPVPPAAAGSATA